MLGLSYSYLEQLMCTPEYMYMYMYNKGAPTGIYTRTAVGAYHSKTI